MWLLISYSCAGLTNTRSVALFQSRFPPNLYFASAGIRSSDEEESRPSARHVSQALAQVQTAAKKENEHSLGSE